jgi:transposase InsO family protein
MGHAQTARQIGIARTTLSGWVQRWLDDRLDPRPLGRPLLNANRPTRNEIFDFLVSTGPRVGLTVLQANFPEVTRSQLQYMQARYRRVWRIQNRRHVGVLHWQRPGTVWAMDHVDAPEALDGVYPYLLAIRDLGSSYQLAWSPVQSKEAGPVLATLQALVRRFGPPLVLKCDNGSPFIAEDVQLWLAENDIACLFSPVRTPSYNGACEAGNGSLKRRTEDLAVLAGRPGVWTCDDAEGALRMANEVNYPWGRNGPTPDEVWQGRVPLTAEERAAFGVSLEAQRIRARQEHENSGTDLQTPLGERAVDRDAIRRTLVEHGLLTFTRRQFTPPIQTAKVTKIT